MKRCALVYSMTALIFGATLIAVPSAEAQEETKNLAEAFRKGTFSLGFNYRYEQVSQDSFDDDGRASTLRTNIGFRTLSWYGLSAFVEVEDVRNLGLDDEHNNAGAGSLGNGVTDRPVIADPPLTEINQGYLQWKPIKALPIRAGRQEIIVDNHRFIGNVLWRQNHQSFDAATIHYQGIENLNLGYIFIGRQRTVTGAELSVNTNHLDAEYSFPKIGKLRAYYLSLEYDPEALRIDSTSTLGASFSGNTKLSEKTKLSYRLELARQNDTGNNPLSIEADYLRADLGIGVGKVNFGAGYEVLGDGGDRAFSTPLATLHKFNGWADLFLKTPSDGLKDLFLSVSAALGDWRLLAVYHDFTADSGGDRYGDELDGSIVWNAPWKQQFALKFALYSADELKVDTNKIWIWTRWKF